MIRKAFVLGAALFTVAQASVAVAAAPAPGTRDFDLACAGLTGVAFQGAKASKASEDTLFALMNAYGIYVGRLSLRSTPGTVKDIEPIVNALSPEDRNKVVNACMAKAKETLGAHLLKPAGAAPKK